MGYLERMDLFMNKYETIMIIDNDITDEQKRNAISKIEEYISKNGKITEAKSMGTRKLAYEIKKHTEGYYYIINFETDAEKIAELERIYRITDEILKFIVIKKED